MLTAKVIESEQGFGHQNVKNGKISPHFIKITRLKEIILTFYLSYLASDLAVREPGSQGARLIQL